MRKKENGVEQCSCLAGGKCTRPRSSNAQAARVDEYDKGGWRGCQLAVSTILHCTILYCTLLYFAVLTVLRYK